MKIQVKQGVIAGLFLCMGAFAESKAIDGTAAIVKGKPILISELEEAQTKITAELKRLNKWDEMVSDKEFQRKVLDQLINDKLLEDELEKRGLAVEDSDIDSAVQSIMKDNQITSMTQFEQVLQTEGFNMAEYRKNLKKQITQSRVMGALVRPQVRVSDEDVKRALKKQGIQPAEEKKYEIELIFKAKPAATAAQMKKIRADITKSGFETVLTREEGNNLGYFSLKDLQVELQKVVPTLKEGEVSPIIENAKGFTLVRVKDIKTIALAESGAEVDAARERLMQEESSRVLEQIVRGLRAKTKIQTSL